MVHPTNFNLGEVMKSPFGRAIFISALLCATVGTGWFATTSLASTRPAAKNLHLVHSGELVFGTDATYPPMESVNSNTNQIVGADIGLGKAIAKQMGLKAVFQNITFDVLITDLTGRHPFDAIISSMNDTPARRKLGVSFVDYLKAVEAMVVQKSSSLHANSYSGICGWSIAVESGTTEEAGLKAANNKCKNKINIAEFPTDTAAYEDFASHHVEAYTTDYPVAAKYVKNHPTLYKLAGKVIKTGEFYGIGTVKKNMALHGAIAAALSQVKKSGQYLSILKAWGVQGGAI